MSLSSAPKQTKLRINKLLLNENVRKYLESMGLVASEPIIILSENKGSLICKIRNSRLALNKEIAEKIIVEMEENVCI